MPSSRLGALSPLPDLQSHLRDGLDLGAICLQLLSYQVHRNNAEEWNTKKSGKWEEEKKKTYRCA